MERFKKRMMWLAAVLSIWFAMQCLISGTLPLIASIKYKPVLCEI